VADVGGDRLEQRNELGWRTVGEEPREDRIELSHARAEHLADTFNPGADLLVGQRTLPTGVRPGEDQCRNKIGMTAPQGSSHSRPSESPREGPRNGLLLAHPRRRP
jgi:hypothetical protein